MSHNNVFSWIRGFGERIYTPEAIDDLCPSIAGDDNLEARFEDTRAMDESFHPKDYGEFGGDNNPNQLFF